MWHFALPQRQLNPWPLTCTLLTPPNPESDRYRVEAIQERFKACQSQRSVLSFSENLRKEQSIYNKPHVRAFVPLPLARLDSARMFFLAPLACNLQNAMAESPSL